jgi:putative addiction module component (TIGR02574 family)
MSPHVKRILDEALSLSDQDRAEIAATLIESLDPDADAQTHEAWDAEIAKRLAEIDSGAVTTIPWPEVRKMLRESVDGQSTS